MEDTIIQILDKYKNMLNNTLRKLRERKPITSEELILVDKVKDMYKGIPMDYPKDLRERAEEALQLAHKVENLIERIGEEEWRRFWDSYPRFPDPLYTIIWGKILRILYFKGQVDEESLINEVYSELKDKGYIKEFVEPSVSFNRKMVRNVLCDSIGKDFRKENGKIFILPSREDLKISMARMLETEEREKELLRMVARYIEKDEKKQEKLLKEWWEKIKEERERELWLRP